MSTSANILITGNGPDMWMYRHSDGYPEVTLESLIRFASGVDPSESTKEVAGDLVAWGEEEYAEYLKGPYSPGHGAYEYTDSTDSMHGDIEFYYEVDLDKREIRVYNTVWGGDYNADADVGELVDVVSF